MNHVLCLFLVAGFLSAAEPAPGTYQGTYKGSIRYVTIDDRRFVTQNEEGKATSVWRLVREDGVIAMYTNWKKSACHLEADATGDIVVVSPKERIVWTPCAAPLPKAVGWKPYELPPTEADPAKRKVLADELIRRFELEQRLRREALQLTHGTINPAMMMQQPEVMAKYKEINRVDEDNKTWLLQTLLSHGWIDRKGHGEQAYKALRLILIHNTGYLRLGATGVAQMEAEMKRGEIGEDLFASLADRFALDFGDPMSYGLQAGISQDGKPLLPILADVAKVEENRKRIGEAPMGMIGAVTILHIDSDGRCVGEGAAPLTGLAALDRQRISTDGEWGLAEAGKADAELGSAITAARSGKPEALTTWTKKVPWQRTIFSYILACLGKATPGVDAEARVVAQRALFEGFLAGTPEQEETRVMPAKVLAYGLVARAVAPKAEELARAVALAGGLDALLKNRPDIANGPEGHAILDTIACVRFRQGKLAAAAELWNRAIQLAGAQAPDLYRHRLTAAESKKPDGVLPRQ